MAPKQLSRPAVVLLQALSHNAATNQLWTWRETAGWAFADELPSYAQQAGHLQRWAELGLILREDVSDPFQSIPHCIHRITQAGQDLLAETVGLEPSEIETVGEVTPEELESMFMAPQAWLGLEFLQKRSPMRWYAAYHVSEAIGRPFYSHDHEFLTTRKLIVAGPGGPDGTLFFRATPLGRLARPLNVTASTRRVQIHVPGINAAARRAGLRPRLPRRRMH